MEYIKTWGQKSQTNLPWNRKMSEKLNDKCAKIGVNIHDQTVKMAEGNGIYVQKNQTLILNRRTEG